LSRIPRDDAFIKSVCELFSCSYCNGASHIREHDTNVTELPSNEMQKVIVVLQSDTTKRGKTGLQSRGIHDDPQPPTLKLLKENSNRNDTLYIYLLNGDLPKIALLYIMLKCLERNKLLYPLPDPYIAMQKSDPNRNI